MKITEQTAYHDHHDNREKTADYIPHTTLTIELLPHEVGLLLPYLQTAMDFAPSAMIEKLQKRLALFVESRTP